MPHDIHECAKCAPARDLLRLGWQSGKENREERIPYFEEAATIYRGLADGEEHLRAAASAISSLGLQYSAVHADDLAMAARHEAAGLMRRANAQRDSEDKDTTLLSNLALALAETGQFTEAVAVQREVVDIWRATGAPGGYSAPDNVAWSLLELAIYLDLAGQSDASTKIDQEALALQRHLAEEKPHRSPCLAIWTAGLSLWCAGSGRPDQARELMIAARDVLPAQGDLRDFGFRNALRGAHSGRSGVHGEQSRPAPVGVDPRLVRQPVLGVSFHHWSFSVRDAYQAGMDAINHAIAASSDVRDLDQLAELGTLVRRRNIRQSVIFNGVPETFRATLMPGLALSVDIERRLFADDPGRGAWRLAQALTDQALGHLVVSDNASAGAALREASELEW